VVAEKSAYRFEVYSEEIQVLMKSLAAPSNLVVRAVSPNQIVLEWKDNSDDEEGFVIERKSNNGDFTEIAKVAKNITKLQIISFMPIPHITIESKVIIKTHTPIIPISEWPKPPFPKPLTI